jgi:hypothetical protein
MTDFCKPEGNDSSGKSPHGSTIMPKKLPLSGADGSTWVANWPGPFFQGNFAFSNVTLTIQSDGSARLQVHLNITGISDAVWLSVRVDIAGFRDPLAFEGLWWVTKWGQGVCLNNDTDFTDSFPPDASRAGFDFGITTWTPSWRVRQPTWDP